MMDPLQLLKGKEMERKKDRHPIKKSLSIPFGLPWADKTGVVDKLSERL